MTFFPQSDDLDATLNAPLAEPRSAPAGYVASTFTEGCRKCGGSGFFRGYSGRVVGKCFTCKGAGSRAFKTAPEVRQAARGNKAQKFGQALEAFCAEHKDIIDWFVLVIDRRPQNPFRFAVSLRDALAKYGSLTVGQVEAARRCIALDSERAVAKTESVANAPAVDTAGVDRLKEAFDKASAFTAAKGKGLRLRTPRITIGSVVISPAKATSANPGALYVVDGGVYLGKIAGGKFIASRDCSSEQSGNVLKFIADPQQAAKVYGQETGVCCVCNASLTSEWRLRGIGPVCAEKFGW